MNDDCQAVIDDVAAELRRVADQLEGDELRLAEPVRYTRLAGREIELPREVEVCYYDDRSGIERTVEVWT